VGLRPTATATTKWGDIGDWDTSGVGDFSFALSKNRNEGGRSLMWGENPKAATFVGTAISKWDTSSTTSLEGTFMGASEMNADLSGWKVAKVVSLWSTFDGASKFTGTGLSAWDTTSATTLFGTFQSASEMNADLSGWKVAKVVTLQSTFSVASKFTGTGVDTWDVAKVTTMSSTFSSTPSLTTCNKRKIADAWKSNSAFVATTYDTDWAGEPWCIGARLTDDQFKQATWDYVQDTAAATTKWGDLGDWDTSGVKDFSYSLSTGRNQQGSYVNGGNPKAATFVGTAISKWDTASATSLAWTFTGASVMNADLTGWKVAKVVNLAGTFNYAYKFTGTGLSAWDTTSATNLQSTFSDASEMNSDLTGWKVGKVVTLTEAFNSASKFSGTGLSAWDTASATSLLRTFYYASEMNADLTGWKVAKVTSLESMFYHASKFTGTGLASWDTASVTSLYGTFREATAMNADLSSWDVAKATTLSSTFYQAVNFQGAGLHTWITSSVTTLANTFYEATAMNADLSSWDVAKATTLSFTFYKTVNFKGAGVHTWITSSVTTLYNTFRGATEMNADLNSWSVSKVITLYKTFLQTPAFVGKGLNTWNTSAVTTMVGTFREATAMNADLSSWKINKVTTLYMTFYQTPAFVGKGLNAWNTSAVTSLRSTFSWATEVNVDLRDWDVAKVTDLESTFSDASKFAGTGLDSWITASVTTLRSTFSGATAMNVDLRGWNVTKVHTLQGTFENATSFVGTGLDLWDTSTVTNMYSTFSGASAMNAELSNWDVRSVSPNNAAVALMPGGGTNWMPVAGTELTGPSVGWGYPEPVTLMVDLGDNVWIVGILAPDYIKMVKIKISGTSAFVWKETRYQRIGLFPSRCGVPSTFAESCFAGTNPLLDKYPVSLTATKCNPLCKTRSKDGIRSMFANTKSLGGCQKRKIADSWFSQNAAAFETSIDASNPGQGYNTQWIAERCIVRGVWL
jgi:surface protein